MSVRRDTNTQNTACEYHESAAFNSKWTQLIVFFSLNCLTFTHSRTIIFPLQHVVSLSQDSNTDPGIFPFVKCKIHHSTVPICRATPTSERLQLLVPVIKVELAELPLMGCFYLSRLSILPQSLRLPPSSPCLLPLVAPHQPTYPPPLAPPSSGLLSNSQLLTSDLATLLPSLPQ